MTTQQTKEFLLSEPPRPSLALSMLEAPRAALEFSYSLMGFRFMVEDAPQGDGHPIMALPGYLGNDSSMALMRRFLNALGYDAHPWKLGRNLEPRGQRIRSMDDAFAFRQQMESKVLERVEEIHQQTGQKVTLIGWSMGGLYADGLARKAPHCVRQVITLGSPHGDPRGTVVWPLLKKLAGGTTPDHEQNIGAWESLAAEPLKVPTTVIYSHSDGIVAADSALQAEDDPLSSHVHVASSHVGFAYNPKVLWVIAKELQKYREQYQ